MITQCILQCRIPAFGLQSVHISGFSFRAPVLFLLADRYDITPLFGAGLILLFYLNMIAAWNLDLQNGEFTSFADNPDGPVDRLGPWLWFCCHSWLSFYWFLLCNDSSWLTFVDLVSRLLLTRSCEVQKEKSSCGGNRRILQEKQFQSLQLLISY